MYLSVDDVYVRMLSFRWISKTDATRSRKGYTNSLNANLSIRGLQWKLSIRYWFYGDWGAVDHPNRIGHQQKQLKVVCLKGLIRVASTSCLVVLFSPTAFAISDCICRFLLNRAGPYRELKETCGPWIIQIRVKQIHGRTHAYWYYRFETHISSQIYNTCLYTSCNICYTSQINMNIYTLDISYSHTHKPWARPIPGHGSLLEPGLQLAYVQGRGARAWSGAGP